MELKPSEIFYSQDSIMNKFGDYTAHGDTYIGETLDQLLNGNCNVQSIPEISVVQMNGKWFTSDNRRLWVFRKAEEIGFLKQIEVKKIGYIRDDKLTTENGGTSIRVRRGGPGGNTWRTWKPKLPPTTTHTNSNRVYSPNRNTRTFPPYSDHNSNTSVYNHSGTTPDYSNPDTAQNYRQSHVESDVRGNNGRNEEVHVPHRFNSKVEQTGSAVLTDKGNANIGAKTRTCIIL
jgi:hypothetical protein